MKYPNFGALADEYAGKRKTFFEFILGNAQGYLCVALKDVESSAMESEFFWYPNEKVRIWEFLREKSRAIKHLYFCPQLFTQPRRVRQNVEVCPNAWADLDTCDPKLLARTPSVVVQTSPGKYQGYWVFDKPIPAAEAEDISRRIAYNYASHGADRSGWDLSQLLRVPYTPNFKYRSDDIEPPIVQVLASRYSLYRRSDFNIYPEAPAIKEITDDDIPDDNDELGEPLELMQKFRSTLNPLAFGIFSTVPEDDWSAKLWKLGRLLCEAGLNRRQVFHILFHAQCNKYRRDLRNRNDLWRDVKRLFIKNLEIIFASPMEAKQSQIISEAEISQVVNEETFIERYITWAIQQTDAPPQFHQAGAFIALSSVLSGTVSLPTSFGNLIPNLWFMICADTTLARKSTVMKICARLLFEIDEQIQFATDGTMEGILANLQTRDGKPALFYRDEFTGLLQAMTKKDYMSDMPEHLTKLYDGDPMKRLLRKEEIYVRKPVFLILGAGIKSKIQSLMTEEHISSGFIPRFVFLTAETDLSRVRPVGPPIADDEEYRDSIKNEIVDIAHHYARMSMVTNDSRTLGSVATLFKASLTQEAWQRYNELELTMTKDAVDVGKDYLTPVYDRLAKSTLKAAMLISASEQREKETVTVSLKDLVRAIYYCRGWRDYASEMISGIGKSPEERTIDRITVLLRNSKGGIPRSRIMRDLSLTAKTANSILDTMVQRRIVNTVQVGNDVVLNYERETPNDS